jgi:lipopolysaccharide/colanic/teichoic acid biosynthesis glycosyltransferase
MSLYQLGKRLLDLMVATSLSVLFLPFWLIVPVLIKLDSSGPVLFKQSRVGKGGKPFTIFKFRSMVPNADELLWKDPRYKKLRDEFTRLDWKLEDDPRATKVGRYLRRLSIDEFPQVLNVLKGEMSIVGPRAYRERELRIQQKKYPQTKNWIKQALAVKPGITGLWQVSGRNDVPFDKRVEIDAQYASRKSLWEDLITLLRTPKAMLSRW